MRSPIGIKLIKLRDKWVNDKIRRRNDPDKRQNEQIKKKLKTDKETKKIENMNKCKNYRKRKQLPIEDQIIEILRVSCGISSNFFKRVRKQFIIDKLKYVETLKDEESFNHLMHRGLFKYLFTFVSYFENDINIVVSVLSTLRAILNHYKWNPSSSTLYSYIVWIEDISSKLIAIGWLKAIHKLLNFASTRNIIIVVVNCMEILGTIVQRQSGVYSSIEDECLLLDVMIKFKTADLVVLKGFEVLIWMNKDCYHIYRERGCQYLISIIRYIINDCCPNEMYWSYWIASSAICLLEGYIKQNDNQRLLISLDIKNLLRKRLKLSQRAQYSYNNVMEVLN